MSILIVGGGICGLTSALLLARDGHDVTILDRDTHPPPQSPLDAWDRWQRDGVRQFRQPHNLMPGLRLLLEAELPDVQASLAAAGASRFDLLHPLPPFLSDRSPRPVDDQLWTLTARRPVAEWVFAREAEQNHGITVRRGIHVTGLIRGTAAIGGTPHVVGVRAAGGEEIRADLVVDASGRESPSAQWLAAIGARAPYEEQEDCGFTYYTRYFHCSKAPERAAPVLTAFESMSLLTLPGDDDTWSITIFVESGDQPLKNLRHEHQWSAAIRACPLHAHWIDGDAITDVLPMAGIADRYRRFTVDGTPVATGFVALADAWACTNPSAGRGLTVGALHARLLRDVLRSCSDQGEIAREFDRRTESEIAPWYHAQIAVDRARFGQMMAAREGRPAPRPNRLAARIGILMSLMLDPDLFRASLEYIGTVTPVQTILERPEVAERIHAARDAMKEAPPMQIPGPNRKELLELVSPQPT